MANTPNYACTECGSPTLRDKLTVKKVMFTEMGVGPSTLRSRVIGWLCPSCLIADMDYQREKFSPPRVVTELV